MAPLFGQRQKVPEELATSNQCQTHASSSSSGGGGTLSSATMDSHSQCMNSSRTPHSANPHHHSSGSRNGHHHHRQEAPPPLPLRQPGPNDTCHVISGDTTAIRKYLVLLQDCLAIKFAPLVNGHQSHPIPFTFTANKNCNSGHNCVGVDDEDDPLVSHRPTDLHHQRVSANSSKGGSNSINESHSNSRNLQSNHLPNHNSNNHHQHNHFPLGNNTSSIHNNEDPQQAFHLQNHHKSSRPEQFHFLQSSSGTASRPSASCNGVGAILGSNTAEVDHSLHGLYLYKGFKEANIQCYWNSALSETFKNIQYKGYIVPSTILVGALPKFLGFLTQAWSKQMLRGPPGFRIEFIGEIEEVIADPIQKGQFAPLSDSLCWAILELTSLGQEAFVDSIMSALQITFPTMSCPSRELVFQTLEKLIKERKVYQTSRGYFVVTPDIFRYMLSGNFHNVESSPSFNNPGLTLDALLHPNCQEHDKLSFSHHSWDSAVSTGDHNRCSSTSTGEELIAVAPSPKLKRHNSLKTIRQRDVAVTQMSASTGQRRHSLRLPKSKSCGRMNDSIDDEEVKTAKVKSSTLEHISRAMRSLRTGTSNTNNHDGGAGEAEKGKKNKSLLSKLFPFRRSNSKPRNEKITATSTSTKETTKPASGSTTSSTSTSNSSMSPPTNSKHSGNVKDSAKFISTQTQTSNSTEQLCAPSITLSSSSSSHPVASSVPTGSNDKNSSRMTGGESSTPENSSDMDGCLLHQDCLNGDGSHQTRSSSRRSMSMLDESPLYDVLQDVPNIPGINQISPNFQVGCPVAPPTFPGFHRGESSRCSTLSSQAASSLGYGSQGHPSHLNTYSPNLDSGLASYGYYGDSSMSHSPCPSTGAYCSPSNHYGYNNRNSNNCSTIFPQPAKPTAYSSARYKSSYEWYRKRYPNYISPVGRSSPLYASLTAPRTKSRSRPTYESLLTPNDVKHGGGLVQMVENHRCPSASQSQQQNANTNKTTLSVNATMGNNTNDAQGREHTSTNTTTVTQAVKSTTNMELELLLPLGKIMKAALHAKKDAIRDAWLRDELGPGYAAYADRYKNNQSATASNNINESIKVNLDNTGAKLRVGEPSTKTEVTTVVNNNGVIETHFDSSSGINQQMFDLGSPNMKSTVEIKTLGGVTDVVLVNGKTGEETKILPSSNQEKGQNNNNGAKPHVSSAQSKRSKSSGVTRRNNNAYEKIPDKRSPSSCVKISDIGKDSGAEEDVIKGC